jgi:hypothetical protein
MLGVLRSCSTRTISMTVESTKRFLQDFMNAFEVWIERLVHARASSA